MKVNFAGTINNAGLNRQKSHQKLCESVKQKQHIRQLITQRLAKLKTTQNFKLLSVVVE